SSLSSSKSSTTGRGSLAFAKSSKTSDSCRIIVTAIPHSFCFEILKKKECAPAARAAGAIRLKQLRFRSHVVAVDHRAAGHGLHCRVAEDNAVTEDHAITEDHAVAE